jgi:hypothetical protein
VGNDPNVPEFFEHGYVARVDKVLLFRSPPLKTTLAAKPETVFRLSQGRTEIPLVGQARIRQVRCPYDRRFSPEAGHHPCAKGEQRRGKAGWPDSVALPKSAPETSPYIISLLEGSSSGIVSFAGNFTIPGPGRIAETRHRFTVAVCFAPAMIRGFAEAI